MADPSPAPGVLHVVATPIGNLEDLTLRALRVLREVDLVACEDTRRTGLLLRSQGITTPTTSYFEQNERWKGERILAELRRGRSVALVSDAGTPGISDPGFRLVRDARAEGLPVIPVPGPSAAAAALSVSGLPTDRFLFVGFLPSPGGPEAPGPGGAGGRRAPRSCSTSRRSGPPRRSRPWSRCWADREAFLCREATKLHEEYLPGTLLQIRESLLARDRVRGELVLVVAGATDGPRNEDAVGRGPLRPAHRRRPRDPP